MTDIFTVTLGFVPARIWEASLDAYHKTRNTALPYKHFFVDQHYPLNKSENRAALRAICEQRGVTVLDPGRNLGLHEGFNWALREVNPPKGSIVIGYDPDSNPLTPGWDMALVRAILGDPLQRVVWSSLFHVHTPREMAERGYTTRKADGFINMMIAKRAMMNSVCAWSCDWLKSVGGLTEPNQWYGHLEAAMFSKLHGKDWAFLPDWIEDETHRMVQDHEYMVYKWELAHNGSTTLDFESWLAQKHE